ncbi:hypothetical protein SAMN02745220_03311 [Desulfopila aestuarii DSM 18488]|uniref:Uncharacterized protein n=1 Tax=Desulfopila aestuarii DSM 18488 TaxID=1121416 RepID=A0A1M7YC46_9BACT|nr:hypothetical protein SAMN02745220_03311 [Desulfopila aestuarii DSM 18488]
MVLPETAIEGLCVSNLLTSFYDTIARQSMVDSRFHNEVPQ